MSPCQDLPHQRSCSGELNTETMISSSPFSLYIRAKFQSLQNLQKTVKPLFAKREYQKALFELAKLRETVDQFFDDVMVMVDDEALKNNRLAILENLRGLFLQVADLSRLQS